MFPKWREGIEHVDSVVYASAEISCDKARGKLQKRVLYVTQYQRQKYYSK